MSATVLVTGGYGFIGASLVRRLVRRGDRVLIIDRLAEGNSADEVLTEPDRVSVDYLSAEVPDPEQLAGTLAAQGVRTVVHLASPLASATEVDPAAVVRDMIDPHLRVLEAARQAGVARVVWASSVGVFGRARDYPAAPVPDDAPLLPFTLYGAGKALLERLTEGYGRCHGMESLALRFPLVYGPSRQRGPGQFTTRLIEGAALGQRVVVAAPGERYDWMYVDDAARCLVQAIDIGSAGSPALTVGGTRASVREVAALLLGWFPAAPIELGEQEPDQAAETDTSAAVSLIGYKPATSLRDGVLATANAARLRAGLPVVT
jgi:nucleoside-diphosphate-sugar epimerase